MKRNPEVDAYLQKQAPDRRAALEVIRSLIFEIVPDGEELIKHGMPFYEANGELFAFASQKRYMSLYVMDTDALARYKRRLTGLDCGKSCIRFRRIEQLPVDVVRSILEEANVRRA
jgi:uncharacterized protein YdhG (YjbR/CyaY superfamily)